MVFKKLLVGMASICMVFSGLPQTVLAADTSGIVISADWSVGDTVEGFYVSDISYSDAYQSKVITFEHSKTGAKVIWFQNDAVNRCFSIGFHTPAENDKGINHIIEHSLISGSEKYPASDIAFSMLNNTYTSYMNAYTYQNMTMYPVSSCSEAQLLKDADVYLDCMFHPLVLQEENIFKREAWRYELSDLDGDITVNGTVYNEMKGALGDISTAAYENMTNALFDGTDQGTNSGGDPEAITTLTYEELCDTYHEYYHPSNCLVTLFGDVDCRDFLQLINSYFSEYNKKEVTFEHETTEEYDGVKKATYEFPVSRGTDTENKSIIEYAMALDDVKNISKEDIAALSLIATLLNAENYPFMQTLTASGIASSYSVGFSESTYQPVFLIMAQDADPSRVDELYTLVDTELEKVVKNGIDTEYAKSMINSLQYSQALASEGSAGLSTCTQVQYMNDTFGDALFDLYSTYDTISSKLGDGYLEKLVTKYLIENKRKMAVTTTPSAGLQEINEKKQEREMQALKESMSTEELQQLITDTDELMAFNNQETDSDVIESLKGVSVEDLPVEITDYAINDITTEEGVRILTTKAEIDKVNQTTMVFDESHLSLEELCYLQFYSQMLISGMPTTNYSESEILNKQANDAALAGIGVQGFGDYDETNVYPIFELTYYGMESNYQNSIDLIAEVLLNSDLKNAKEYIQRNITNQKATYSAELADPYVLGIYHALGYCDELYRYYDYFSGLEYYSFILDLEEEFEKNPSAVIDKLIEVRDKAFSTEDLTILFAGDQKSINTFNSDVNSFVEQLPQIKTEAVEHELPVASQKEAWITSSDVEYVIWGSGLKTAGISYDGTMPTMISLLNDGYLLPAIRFNGGAYSVAADISNSLMYLYTYRDANYFNSLNVIDSMDDYMAQISNAITEDTLDNYILSSFASYSIPRGTLTDATLALNYKLINYTVEERENFLEQMKSTTLDDCKEFIDVLEKLEENGNYLVISTRSEIEEHKDLFDKIVELY